MAAPGNVSVQWFGLRELVARLQSSIPKTQKAAATALYREANRIMARSIPITPKDTGNLRASGHVDLPVLTASGSEVRFGYGGAAAPYAVYVHEVPAYHKPPTRWKFLEQPVLEAQAGLAKRLAADMNLGL